MPKRFTLVSERERFQERLLELLRLAGTERSSLLQVVVSSEQLASRFVLDSLTSWSREVCKLTPPARLILCIVGSRSNRILALSRDLSYSTPLIRVDLCHHDVERFMLRFMQPWTPLHLHLENGETLPGLVAFLDCSMQLSNMSCLTMTNADFVLGYAHLLSDETPRGLVALIDDGVYPETAQAMEQVAHEHLCLVLTCTSGTRWMLNMREGRLILQQLLSDHLFTSLFL